MHEYAGRLEIFLTLFDQALQEAKPLKLQNCTIRSEFLSLVRSEYLLALQTLLEHSPHTAYLDPEIVQKLQAEIVYRELISIPRDFRALRPLLETHCPHDPLTHGLDRLTSVLEIETDWIRQEIAFLAELRRLRAAGSSFAEVLAKLLNLFSPEMTPNKASTQIVFVRSPQGQDALTDTYLRPAIVRKIATVGEPAGERIFLASRGLGTEFETTARAIQHELRSHKLLHQYLQYQFVDRLIYWDEFYGEGRSAGLAFAYLALVYQNPRYRILNPFVTCLGSYEEEILRQRVERLSEKVAAAKENGTRVLIVPESGLEETAVDWSGCVVIPYRPGPLGEVLEFLAQELTPLAEQWQVVQHERLRQAGDPLDSMPPEQRDLGSLVGDLSTESVAPMSTEQRIEPSLITRERIERKLAAIFSADVQGYSKLMGDNEEETIRTLTTYRAVIASLIQQHRGRVVDSPGDNLLAEFASAVDAVRCAVEIQQELQTRNRGLPLHRQMVFRIGINLGDVVVEGERIYGEGVNIAARLEGLAEGGGICLSGAVYDQIENKLGLQYTYLGEQTVKNIAKPIRVYRIQRETGTAAPAASESLGYRQSRGRFFAIRYGLRNLQPFWKGVLVVVGLLWALWGIRVILYYTWGVPLPSGPWRHGYQRALSVEHSLKLTLPDKPSIGVLPFVNMSADPNQEYFSDGITEDLITELAKLSGLFVIARNSVFLYKGQAVKPMQISQELGVRYLLEGSIRKAGNTVRITAQLIDATTGYHLWAERYDRDLQDIFAVQDEITQQIVSALQVKLTAEEHTRLTSKYSYNLAAYDYYLRGLEHCTHCTKESNAQARQMFAKAIDLDPNFAVAYAHLGDTYFSEWVHQWSYDPQSLEQALELAQKALSLDDNLPLAHRGLAKIYLWKKQHVQAIAQAERTLVLAPNDAHSYAVFGDILNWSGRPQEAIALVEKALRLDPYNLPWHLFSLGHACYLLGKHEEAITTLKRILESHPNHLGAHVYLAVLYSELGQEAQAQAEGRIVLQLSPEASLEKVQQRFPYQNPADLQRLLDGLRKAGFQ